MKKNDVFPSKYLKAADLGDKPITVTIERVAYETLKAPDGKEQQKIVLHFVGAKKVLPLNITNFDSVVDITLEDDTERWPGHKLELYGSEAQLGSKMVPCVRIRAPEQPELPTKQKPTAAKSPTKKPPVADEMSDEIPW